MSRFLFLGLLLYLQAPVALKDAITHDSAACEALPDLVANSPLVYRVLGGWLWQLKELYREGLVGLPAAPMRRVAGPYDTPCTVVAPPLPALDGQSPAPE